MNQKETFLKRFSERYGDLDLENEENYYERANALMDDYERYESATKNLIESIDGNEAFMQMLTEACTQDDFDPVVWMVEQRGLDLQEAMENPDYAEVIAQAHSKYLEEEAKSRAIDEEMRRNLPASLEAIDQKAAELGIDEATKNACVASLWELGEQMVKGVLPTDMFELVVKGRDHDRQLQEAFERGREEGLNIRIDEHLRQVRYTPEDVGATQTPLPTTPRRPKTKNPFRDADWD